MKKKNACQSFWTRFFPIFEMQFSITFDGQRNILEKRIQWIWVFFLRVQFHWSRKIRFIFYAEKPHEPFYRFFGFEAHQKKTESNAHSMYSVINFIRFQFYKWVNEHWTTANKFARRTASVAIYNSDDIHTLCVACGSNGLIKCFVHI